MTAVLQESVEGMSGGEDVAQDGERELDLRLTEGAMGLGVGVGCQEELVEGDGEVGAVTHDARVVVFGHGSSPHGEKAGVDRMGRSTPFRRSPPDTVSGGTIVNSLSAPVARSVAGQANSPTARPPLAATPST